MIENQFRMASAEVEGLCALGQDSENCEICCGCSCCVTNIVTFVALKQAIR